MPRPEDFGFTDEKLLSHPTVYAPDLFKGKQGWTTPLRATNRLLAGPFRTASEAQAFVNQLGKSGLSAFAWQSEAGQKIERLRAR